LLALVRDGLGEKRDALTLVRPPEAMAHVTFIGFYPPHESFEGLPVLKVFHQQVRALVIVVAELVAEKDAVVTKLPLSLFTSLGIAALVVVLDEPSSIAGRLAQRDGTVFDVSFVRMFQEQELDHAESVALKLRIPLRRVSADEPLSALASWISENWRHD
jgi:hypothetical protein